MACETGSWRNRRPINDKVKKCFNCYSTGTLFSSLSHEEERSGRDT
jgi:Pyruvate/2-oxoacid:ferredoxin oxidoreductase delta subunit